MDERCEAMKLGDWAGVGMQAPDDTKPTPDPVDWTSRGDGDPVAVRLGGGVPGDDVGALPGEAIHVYRVESNTIDPKTGARLKTENRKFTGEGQFVYGETMLARGSLWKESAALAMMRKSPSDIRPELLLLEFG